MAVHAERRTYQRQSVTTSESALQAIFSALLILTATIAFAIAIVTGIVIGYGLYYQDQVYPGVRAIGVDIGGVTPVDAEAQLNAKTNAYLESEITLVYEDQTFQVTPVELGVEFDNARSVENAYSFGRGDTWWTDSWEWFDSLMLGRDVGVYATVDADVLEAYLRTISNEIGVSPQNAEVRLNEAGELEVIAAAEGTGIDVAETLRDVRAEATSLGSGPVEITTSTIPPAYDETALESLHEQLSGILAEPFTMEYAGYEWAFDVSLLNSLLIIDIEPDGSDASATLDSEKLERHISSIAADAGEEGRDAALRWNGQEFVAVPASDGWVVDIDTSVAAAEGAIMNGERSLELATLPQAPTLTTEAAEDAANWGNELAETRFQLTWDDGEADIGGSVIVAALSFNANRETGEFEPEVDLDALELFLTSVSKDVEIEPVNADLRYLDGNVVVMEEEEPGLEMDRALSAEAIAEAVQARETSAEIVVNEAEPEVTAAMAGEIQIREMLSFGETYYGGSSSNRRHNVDLATQRANGALVPPGGVYSFVKTIGDISVDSGYELGFGIIAATDGGVTTVPSVGGGVCQVSTTVFQAAFWAGMPIVERSWHLYWMPLYGQDPSGITGLDATVDTSAGLDFKFENTTDDWIAIVATADGNAVRFEVWGTDPGWNVETDGPHISNRVQASTEMQYEESDRMPAGTQTRVETAHDGFDVLIERRVYDSDGELIDELELFSQYQPASNRTLIGTGD